MSDIKKQIQDRIKAMDRYVSTEGFDSYDPYDGLSSPFSLMLFNSQLLQRVWQQAIKRSPVNVRSFIGIRKMSHTKTISDFASAYCLLYHSTRKEDYAVKARALLSRLKNMNSKSSQGTAWGLRFKFATRFVTAHADEPNIFQTINAIHSFLDGYECLGDASYLPIARDGMDYLINDLGYVETEQGIYWNYWKSRPVIIYNVSGLMIGLCARYGKAVNDKSLDNVTRQLARYIYASQNEDGSWYYSLNKKGHFIDGYHTGYILEGLCRAINNRVIEIDNNFLKGAEYYLKAFFTENLLPKYFHNSLNPFDGQVVAQAIQTLYFLRRLQLVPEEIMAGCFVNSDRLLWNALGYYNYQRTKLLTQKTPMHRWVNGPMFLALSYFFSQLHSYEKSNQHPA